MATVERAIAIAAQAHAGQVDKAGAPYILHPLRVMLAQADDIARMVAVLHDVVEDTAVGFDDLCAEGFPSAVLEALASVTKREGEAYDEFVARASANPIGRQVKLADLIDNSDLSRIAVPTERDHQRLEKYQRAIEQIRAMEA